ncbi:MAG: hypothetical protein ACXVCH_18130, partial [Bdellovibrionota bacterium]
MKIKSAAFIAFFILTSLARADQVTQKLTTLSQSCFDAPAEVQQLRKITKICAERELRRIPPSDYALPAFPYYSFTALYAYGPSGEKQELRYQDLILSNFYFDMPSERCADHSAPAKCLVTIRELINIRWCTSNQGVALIKFAAAEAGREARETSMSYHLLALKTDGSLSHILSGPENFLVEPDDLKNPLSGVFYLFSFHRAGVFIIGDN